jgi:DNA-binding response OmpR family regulator
MQSYELKGPGKSIVLPKQEYQLMELFMMNQNIYLSSEKLLEKIWGYDTSSELGNVWVYISNLRKRLKETGSVVGIQAKRNIGYRLEK